jgi:FdhD protein
LKKSTRITVHKNTEGITQEISDEVAIEEPLEFSICFGPDSSRSNKNIAITMRTPGNDFELAIGFLFSEGVINNKNDILSVSRNKELVDDSNAENTVLIELNESVKVDPDKIRNFYINSSCGICGSSMVEGISKIQPIDSHASNLEIEESVLRQLPENLRQKQDAFGLTGGLHASALFNVNGEILHLFEDVGRHNALDKLIGQQINENALPLSRYGLMLSGRTSFELVHKSALAGIPIIVAIGAPSSLAIEAAWEYEITLIGFLNSDRFNIYSYPKRII